jgi:hypothetical protein
LKIAELLEESHLTQTGLAELVGTTQKPISELATETGKTNLPPAVRIEQATHGLVMAEEVPLHEEDRAALDYLRPAGSRKRRAA